MTKILFVCHGNICRSPMAEFVMRDLLSKAGLDRQVVVASAATSAEELGNPVHPGTRKKLEEHGMSCGGKTARRLTRTDYALGLPAISTVPGRTYSGAVRHCLHIFKTRKEDEANGKAA